MPRVPEPLGQVQLEVLRYVTEHAPIRVRDVAEHFAKTSGKARTTILTVMEKLREKNYLSRKKVEGAWHYSPRVPEKRVLRSVVNRFVTESLGGSVAPFLAYLAEARDLSEDELNQLKQLVADLEKREQGGDA